MDVLTKMEALETRREARIPENRDALLPLFTNLVDVACHACCTLPVSSCTELMSK